MKLKIVLFIGVEYHEEAILVNSSSLFFISSKWNYKKVIHFFHENLIKPINHLLVNDIVSHVIFNNKY